MGPLPLRLSRADSHVLPLPLTSKTQAGVTPPLSIFPHFSAFLHPISESIPLATGGYNPAPPPSATTTPPPARLPVFSRWRIYLISLVPSIVGGAVGEAFRRTLDVVCWAIVGMELMDG
jgi:hypothetical protein